MSWLKAEDIYIYIHCICDTLRLRNSILLTYLKVSKKANLLLNLPTSDSQFLYLSNE